MVKNSDWLAQNRDKLRFNPPVWSKKPKIIFPSQSVLVKSLFKPLWKKNHAGDSKNVDDFFLIDNSEQNGKNDGLEKEVLYFLSISSIEELIQY